MEAFEEGARSRSALSIAKVEAFYLAALRVISLLLATALIVYAVWLAIMGTYNLSRDASTVKEQPVEITAGEVAALPVKASSERPADDLLRSEKVFYKNFVDRYYALYINRYQSFQKPKDRKINRAAFDEQTIKTTSHLQAISEGDLNFTEDKERLEYLLKTMSEVAVFPTTVQKLRQYNIANRKTISRVVSGTRSERYCSYYGYYIGECISYDTRQVPYKRTVTEARLPQGVIEPMALFQRQQENFFSLLTSRKEQNASRANNERERIIDGNNLGSSSLSRAIQLAGGFLVVMFLFLLIAIERHQRKIAVNVVS